MAHLSDLALELLTRIPSTGRIGGALIGVGNRLSTLALPPSGTHCFEPQYRCRGLLGLCTCSTISLDGAEQLGAPSISGSGFEMQRHLALSCGR